MAVGFFDLFFDSEYRQRQDINALESMETSIAGDVAVVGAQLRRLQVSFRELSATTAVLMEMLAEAGQLDPKVVRYRVEAKLEEMLAPPAGPSTVRCVLCGRDVPAASTLVTGDGPTCDPTCAP